jgi:hypothetical protein
MFMINLQFGLRRQKDNIESSDYQRCHQLLRQHGNLRSNVVRRGETPFQLLLYLSYLPILIPNDLRVRGLMRSSLAWSNSSERQAIVSVELSGTEISPSLFPL